MLIANPQIDISESVFGDFILYLIFIARFYSVMMMIAGDIDVGDEHVEDAPIIMPVASAQTAPSNISTNGDTSIQTSATEPDYLALCPTDDACDSLPASCLDCHYDSHCVYGQSTTASCSVKPGISCMVSCTYIPI